MNYGLPMYEGDGLIRQGLSTNATPAESEQSVRDFDALKQLEIEARRIRAEYVGSLIKRLMVWVRDFPRTATQSRAEHYLSASTDHADVERRIRSLERDHVRGWNQRIPA
jgi:hypothetical protein